MAHGESSLNIDFLLFDKYFNKLPNLKLVIFELSYHSLEDFRDNNWNKNHLFHYYYGINNYDGRVPIKDQFLITSNFKEYFRIFINKLKNNDEEKFNKYGFFYKVPITRFELYKYDSLVIRSNSFSKYIKDRHQEENLDSYKKNRRKLDSVINVCLNKNIKVILLSPPKYYLYNRYMNKEKFKRRDIVFDKYRSNSNIYIWNFERKFEYQIELFANEDHLNPKGANFFTKKLDSMLLELKILTTVNDTVN